MRRIAVVGSGIAGLAVAHGLAGIAQVTLFEAGSHFGGHTNTVDLTLDGVTHGVDTGFLVLNERTYPRLLALFSELGVEIAPSQMSFSVQAPGLEWSGNSLNSVFAQRRNLGSPRFWRMKGKDIFIEQCNEDLYAAIDQLMDKLDRQVCRHKDRLQDHHHTAPKRIDATPA